MNQYHHRGPKINIERDGIRASNIIGDETSQKKHKKSKNSTNDTNIKNFSNWYYRDPMELFIFFIQKK